jgi:hypothetical protein
MQEADPKLKLESLDAVCVTAAGNKLRIRGLAHLLVKIQGFAWKFPFLVVQDLVHPVILGCDFFLNTKLVLYLSASRCVFTSAPNHYVPVIPWGKGKLKSLSISEGSEPGRKSMFGKLSSQRRDRLLSVIRKYPDILTKELGLTHLVKYHIRVVDPTPVRLPPYRLAPPKMQFLRKHIQELLEQGLLSHGCPAILVLCSSHPRVPGPFELLWTIGC